MQLRQQILAAIATPDAAFAVAILGALLIYVEFIAPGKVIPGAAGSVLFLLGLTTLSHFTVAWTAAALLLLGLGLLLAHSTVIGALAFVAGAWNLVPGIHLWVAASLGAPFAVITSFLFSVAVRARRNKTETMYL